MKAQILLLTLWLISLGWTLAKHGEEKEEMLQKHNIGLALLQTVIAALILWWGGFWNCFKA